MSVTQGIILGSIQKAVREIKADLTSEESVEIMISTPSHTIDGETQPSNGSIFFSSWLNTTITLPLTEKFKRFGSKIIIIANGSDKTIIPASDYSNDIVIYEGNAYDHNSSFKLTNRGFVELFNTSGGWYVTSSNGFSLNEI